MADVGVLNLQIQADASQATGSLTKLANALNRVKTAVGRGLSFGSTVSNLEKLKNALGGNWTGSETFKTAMKNIQEGMKQLSDTQATKLSNTAKSIDTLANAYQKILGTLNAAKSDASSVSKATSTIKQASETMSSFQPKTAATMSSSMFGGRFAQHFNALNDVDSDYGKIANGLKQVEDAAKDAGSSAQNIKNVADAVKQVSGSKVDNAQATATSQGISIISTAIKELDSGSISNIQALATALKELKGLGGIGTNLKSIAEGLKAMSGATKKADALASAIRIDASAINRFKSVSEGFSVPSFNNLIKLAESMHSNPDASVHLKRIAEALAAIKGVGDFKVPNLSGLTGATKGATGSQDASTGAVTAMQKVGAVADETAGKLVNVGQEVQEAMAHAQTAASGVADDVANQMARILPDNMTWYVGESLTPVTGQLKTSMDEATQAAAGMKSSMAAVSDAAHSTSNDVEVAFKDSSAEIAKYQQDTLARITDNMQRRLAALPKMFGNSSAEIKEWAAKGVSMETDQLFGNANPAAAAVQTAQAMDGLTQATQNYTSSATNMQQVAQGAAQGLQQVQQSAQGATSQIQNVQSTAATSTGTQPFSDIMSGIDSVVNSMSSAQASVVQSAMDMEQQIASLTGQEQQMRNALAADIQAGLQDANAIAYRAAQIRLLQTEQARLYTQLLEMEHAQKLSTRAMSALRGAFDNLRGGIKNLGIARLTSQMLRMAKMRALRYMIRELAKGFREGVENVYHYSEAIGSSFAPAMDSAKTALNQMKNSIGAAVAPALQALIPLFNTIVGWITTAVNYINQFFSLLSGKSTWTRALPVATKAFDEQKKAAKGASDSVKDMLADFDELNIIQQNGGGSGSGSGSTATDYTEMFEEVNEFDSKIKDMVQWIEEHMETVKGIAIAIGVAILGWKLSKAFEGAVGSLGAIVAGGAIAAIGLQVSYEGAYAAGLSGGFDTSTIMTTIAGSLASGVGGAIIGYKLAGPSGAIMGAIVGVGVGVAVSINAYKKGQRMAEELGRWGSLKVSADKMKEQIQKLYSFSIHPNVELLTASIESIEKAKASLNLSAIALGMQIRSVKMKVSDDIAADMEALKASCDDVITNLETYLTTERAGLSIAFDSIKFYDSEENDITSDLLNQIEIDDKTLMSYFNDLGEQMAAAMYAGQQSGWKNGEYEQMVALAERQFNIVNGAEQLALQLEMEQEKFDILNNTDIANLDRESAKKLMEEIDAYEKSFTEPLREMFKQQRSALYSRAAIVEKQMQDLTEHWMEDGLTESEYLTKLEEMSGMKERYLAEAALLSDEQIEQMIAEQLGVGEVRRQIQERMGEILREKYLTAWQMDIGQFIMDTLAYKKYGFVSPDQMKRDTEYNRILLGNPISGTFAREAYSNFFQSTTDSAELVNAINDLIKESLPEESKDMFEAYADQLGGSIFATLPKNYQLSIMQAIMEKATNMGLSGDAAQQFVDSIMLQLYNNDHNLYAQLLEGISKMPLFSKYSSAFEQRAWEQYTLTLPVNVKLEGKLVDVDQLFLENLFGELEGDEFLESGKSRYDFIFEKYGSAALAEMVERIFEATNGTGLTREDIYRMMFGDDFIDVKGSLPAAARYPKLAYMPQEGGLGRYPGYQIPETGTVHFFGTTGTLGETDTRTATATEKTSKECETQNTKIDVLTGLLRAVLGKLNGGIDVTMAPTSTAGKTVGDAMNAFQKVTGWV